MFKTFRELAKTISEKFPELNWIDRDKGQLENPENFHSVLVPGLLLGFSEVDWKGQTRGSQMGECTMTAKLIFRNPVSTYEGAEWNDYPEFELLTMRLHDVITSLPDVGDRRSSSDRFIKNFYVVEQTYDLKVYNTKEIKTKPKPAPTIVSTIRIPTK